MNFGGGWRGNEVARRLVPTNVWFEEEWSEVGMSRSQRPAFVVTRLDVCIELLYELKAVGMKVKYIYHQRSRSLES